MTARSNHAIVTPPHAGPTIAPASFERVIGALGRDADALQGEPLLSWTLSVPIERESTVLRRASLRTPSRELDVFIKVFRASADAALDARSPEAQARAEYEELVRVSRAFVGSAETGITYPLALVAEERAVVTLAARGVALEAFVASEARRFGGRGERARVQAIGAHIAEWLHRYQAMSPPQTLETDALRAYVATRVARLPAAWNRRYGVRILERFDILASQLSFDDRLAVDLHADFTMENVLVDETRVTVLDFVGGRRGSRLNDLTHLVMQLDVAARKPWLDARVIGELQRAMILAFDPALTRDAPAFQLAYLCNAVPRMAHRATMDGSWLTRRYSDYLWHGVERSVLLGVAP